MALPGESDTKDDQIAASGVGQKPNETTTTTTATNIQTAPTPQAKQSTNVDQDDRDFDPSAEALIDEIDDERTLDEEEALDGNNATAVKDELDELKKESEMPIEELLAYYERMRQEAGAGPDEADEEEGMEDEDDEEDEDEEDEDELEVRKRDTSNKCLTDSSKCTSNQSAQQTNHNQCLQPQQSQQQIQTDPSLPTPPNSNSHIDSSINNPQNPNTKLVASEREQSQNHHHLNPPAEATQLSINPVCDRIPTENNSHASAMDEPTTVTSSGRHKHSMTEFMIDPDSAGLGMFRTLLDYDLDDSDDLDEDYSYTDDENCDDRRDWRRVIHVGPEHQADVPEGLTEYEGDLLPYEPPDQLVWRCDSNLTEEQIIDYLKKASLLSKRTSEHSISSASVPKVSNDTIRLYREKMFESNILPSSGLNPIEYNHVNIDNEHQPPENPHDVYMSQSRKRVRIDYELEQENAMDGINQSCVDAQTNYSSNSNREENSNSTSQDAKPELSIEEYFQDEEQLLFLLLQCNYNFDEALRRRRLDPSKYYIHEPMSLWSQEECLGFEHGLRVYGKDFRSIRENKVPTRTHAEVVSFYYLWKKSERHDAYTNQYKIDRKRSLSHPGTTDYMDRFIEDHESMLNATSSTTTPTESTVEVSHIIDAPTCNNPLVMCQNSDPKPSSVPCLNLAHIGIPSLPNPDSHDINEGSEDGSDDSDPDNFDSSPPI